MVNKTFAITISSLFLLTACNNHETLSTKSPKEDSITEVKLPAPPSKSSTNIGKQKAQEDYKNKHLKYYFQSIHYPSKQFIQYMKDSLDISVISASDRINMEFAQYNQEVNHIILAEKRINIDSVLNARP